MASDIASSGRVTTGEHDLVSEAWFQEPSVEGDGLVLYHALSAASLMAPEKELGAENGPDEAPIDAPTEKEAFHAALDLLINLFGAERAFLFQAAGDEKPACDKLLEGCIASRNIDGEEVQQPEQKVPQKLLTDVVQTRRPILSSLEATRRPQEEAKQGETEPVHCVGLPVVWKETTQGILYLENRFRPLNVNRDSLRLAEVHCKVLATLMELGRMEAENRSLWFDISRLRENRAPDVKAAAVSRAHDPARAGKALKRSDLKGDYSMIIGSTAQMIEMFQVLDRIASSNAPVLITGESGTGKELIAQAVHQNSPRHDKVFVSENCGALTETLLESELFGYVKGAFTGANKDHKGLFELAIGGTLFLDEVGDMSPGMQKKLLRVVQEGVIRRVGGKEYVQVDVRIISATNKDLIEEVRAGNFREDLYYRLNVINLKLPPLRERKEDIPELVDSFLGNLAHETGISRKVEPPAIQRLTEYGWPGNIRELQNEVRRMFALADGDIRLQDLSETVLAGDQRDFPFQDLERELSRLTLREATERLEKEMIRNTLIQCRGNKSLVAKMLQVPKTSLYNKINKYGLEAS